LVYNHFLGRIYAIPKSIGFRQNECIFEIRYKPNPKLLDRRGEWAESVSSHTKLEQWLIADNRIDIFNTEEITHMFLGYKNSGLTINDVPNKEYFPNYVEDLI
jgi:hypothetical protein